MKINCYCDFIYNAGCELMLWADSYKMENGWKSPILLPVEPTGTRPVTTLEILTPIRWEHCGREVVGSASCVPCPGKIQIIPNREILRCEGQHFQPLVCLCKSWRGCSWRSRHCSWLDRSVDVAASPVVELLYLHSIGVGFQMRPRWVSFSLQQGNGSCCFYIH